jgi:hypothetical protein
MPGILEAFAANRDVAAGYLADGIWTNPEVGSCFVTKIIVFDKTRKI